jgi:beta-phosphoglucomutase-like phosphatase (HAD superfamily)
VSDQAGAPGRQRVRPVTTVLDVLRTEIDGDAFDAVLFSLDTVVADLGYGDIRPLPGAMVWIEQLRHRGKRIGAFATGERAGAALEIAGVAELFDEIAVGTPTVPALLAAIDELGSTPELAIVVAATAGGVAAAREAGFGIVIAVARGLSSPEELRQAGAHAVVADLQEMLRAIT